MMIYHIYPLGMCGAPHKSEGQPMNMRLEQIQEFKQYLIDMGITAVYYGPVFQSESHGYDTIDYYNIDRRLGNNETFAVISKSFEASGIRTIVDGVFNHVSREFFAFQNVLKNGASSEYSSWFYLDFNKRSPKGDPFSYECWEGHFNLVKLNLKNMNVREHLFGAVRQWIMDYNIAGIRLDVAYALDKEFMKDLRKVCKDIRPDFWLMGEVIHGDYRQLLGGEMLDSVTNYESYKGLFSSHNDKNYFEIAYSLNRQFSKYGLYRNFLLYNFVDNHDVSRAASILKDKTHLYPLYVLLMTIPGIPSIYYGSELGIEGDKKNGDQALRQALQYSTVKKLAEKNELLNHIKKLSKIRRDSNALCFGEYEQIYVNNEQFVFARKMDDEYILVMVNQSNAAIDVKLPNLYQHGCYEDVLNPGEQIELNQRKNTVRLYPNWGRILRRKI